MAYALGRTTRLKVGTSVAILPGRHPVLVAKQLASLAAVAPKRVPPVFGLQSAIPAERAIFAVRSRRPDLDLSELIAPDWPALHRQLDAYLAAGLTKFVSRKAGSTPMDAFLDRFVTELLPRQI